MFTSKCYCDSDEVYQLPLFDYCDCSEIDTGVKQLFLFDPDLFAKPEKFRQGREDSVGKYEKRLKKAYERCLDLCSAAGIPVQTVASIRINKRLKSTCGRCIEIARDLFVIEISEWTLEDSIPEHELMDTILHELCHTAKNCMNHQKPWKKLSRSSNHTVFICSGVQHMTRTAWYRIILKLFQPIDSIPMFHCKDDFIVITGSRRLLAYELIATTYSFSG